MADLALDSPRVVVAGDSAGGFLATVLARRARDDGRPLAGQALVYPAIRRAALEGLDDAVGAALGLSVGLMRWHWGQLLDGADVTGATPGDIDPLRADLVGLPPTLVLTAEHDILRAVGEAYADGLVAAGVEVTADRLLGPPHGFLRKLALIPHAGRTVDHVAVWAAATVARRSEP